MKMNIEEVYTDPWFRSLDVKERCLWLGILFILNIDDDKFFSLDTEEVRYKIFPGDKSITDDEIAAIVEKFESAGMISSPPPREEDKGDGAYPYQTPIYDLAFPTRYTD